MYYFVLLVLFFCFLFFQCSSQLASPRDCQHPLSVLRTGGLRHTDVAHNHAALPPPAPLLLLDLFIVPGDTGIVLWS